MWFAGWHPLHCTLMLVWTFDTMCTACTCRNMFSMQICVRSQALSGIVTNKYVATSLSTRDVVLLHCSKRYLAAVSQASWSHRLPLPKPRLQEAGLCRWQIGALCSTRTRQVQGDCGAQQDRGPLWWWSNHFHPATKLDKGHRALGGARSCHSGSRLRVRIFKWHNDI